MPETDRRLADADRLLATFDFAKQSEEREVRHRAELGRLLEAFLDVADLLQNLETHCGQLAAQGHPHVPQASARVACGRMLQALEAVGVQPMSAVGQPLNLEYHEVAEVRYAPSLAEDTVLEERRRGYLWKSHPLRRAQVVVSGSVPSSAQISAHNQGEEP